MLEKILNRYIDQYGDNKESRIASYKQYLSETDYAIIKMYEEVVQGGSIIEMLKEYKEILAKRKEARQLINELEEELEK
jgi:antirestriction protein